MSSIRSLKAQLSLSIMFAVMLTVAVISISSNILINKEFEKYLANQQQEKIYNIAENFSSQFNSETQEWNVEYIHGLGMYALYDGYIVKVYDLSGKTVWDAENHNMEMCADIMQKITCQMEQCHSDVNGEFTSTDYDLECNGTKIGTMLISYYGPYFLSESDFKFMNTLNLVFVVIGIFSLAFSLLIGAILARRITKPITKTAYIAKQISEGDYSIRFEGEANSKELDELAAAINHLAQGLSNQETLRKRLTVDIAHELRTPLTTLASHLEAMIDGVWEPKTERLQSCYEEIGRLSGLVKDLERLAKIEGDNLVLNKTELDLLEIVRMSCDNFEIEMRKKNLSLEIEGDSSIIFADKDRLNQVMTNLLSNAIKYSCKNGNIRIKVNDTENYSQLIVEDDGIGIAEHELSLVFERFYRTDKSRNRKSGGAGIGLAIVKSIVIAHGGTVEAVSCEKGSRFVVILPKEQ